MKKVDNTLPCFREEKREKVFFLFYTRGFWSFMFWWLPLQPNNREEKEIESYGGWVERVELILCFELNTESKESRGESIRLSHLKQCCSFPFVCNPLLLVITQSKIFVLHFVAFGREGIWYMFPSSPFVLCESESYWVYVGYWVWELKLYL